MVALAHADRLPAIPAGHRRRGPDQDLQFRRQLAAREHEGGEADVALQYHQVVAAEAGCDKDQRWEPVPLATACAISSFPLLGTPNGATPA